MIALFCFVGIVASVADVASVKVSERFGFDPVDSTAYLQKALDSGLPRIVIDRQSSPWHTRPLYARSSNQEVVFEEGVSVVAKRGEFKGLGDRLLTLRCVTNVTLRGPGAELRMWKCDYTNAALYAKSEWRHTIAVYSSNRILIEGLNIVESGGDGIYLGEALRGHPNTDVTVRNVVCSGCNRQGISVITADGLRVENSLFKNTCGAPPESGIDFEPNNAWQVLSKILLHNCVFENNAGHGIEIEKICLSSNSRPLDIRIDRCVSRGNRKGRKVRLELGKNPLHDVHGRVVCRNCRFLDDDQTPDGLRVKDGQPTPFTLFLKKCIVRDPSSRDGTTVMNERWPYTPALCDPDGKEIACVPFRPQKHVTVCDSNPGKMTACSSPWVRCRTRYHLYASKAGPVNMLVERRWISKQKFGGTFRVFDENGVLVANLPPPGKEKTAWSFTAPAPGFYELLVDVGQQMFNVLSCDVPIAMTGGGHTYDADPALIAPGGEFYLPVPQGIRYFAVIAEGRERETVSVRVFDPSGNVASSVGELTGRKTLFIGANPPRGLWKVVTEKPAKGTFEDHSIDIVGVPFVLFLNNEKTWISN